MKVVVTGATGAIGSYIVKTLEQRHALTLVTRREIKTPHRTVRGDLTEVSVCERALEGAEAVVHLGAISEAHPDAFRVNVLSTYLLMEAARKQGVRRVVMASTNCVYGHCYRVTSTPFPVQYLPIDESHSLLPEDTYGLSKVVCEEILATFSRAYGITTCGLRLAWVWGPKEIQWRAALPELNLAEHAPYFWAYVDARDAAHAFQLALEAPQLPPYGGYNLTAADTMAKENSAELAAQFYPNVKLPAPLRGRDSFFTCQRAAAAFGYQANYSWRDGWADESALG